MNSWITAISSDLTAILLVIGGVLLIAAAVGVALATWAQRRRERQREMDRATPERLDEAAIAAANVAIAALLPFEMPIDGTGRDAKKAGCHTLVAAGVVKGNVDRFPLEFLKRRPNLECERMLGFGEGRNVLR